MRGIFYSLIVFIVMSGLIAYYFFLFSETEKNFTFETEKISAQRVFSYWKNADRNLGVATNISVAKINNTVEFGDTLPAEKDISTVLDQYQQFIRNYFEDSTIDVRFEDESGNEIELENLQSKILIEPMNIEYSWPDFGKNQMHIKVPATNYSFIQRINITLRVKPNIRNANNSWSPYKACTGSTQYCLYMNLTVTDGTTTWVSDKNNFDLDFTSSAKIDLQGEPAANFWVKITAGKIPTVINVDMQNANVSADTKLILNTEQFYITYPAKLNVTTPFARKIDWL